MTASISPNAVAQLSIRSLPELKKEHYRLLELTDAAEGAGDNAEILKFLNAGTALGQVLSAPAERAEAQRMLDYWASSLSAEQLGETPELIFRRAVLLPCDVADQPQVAEVAIKAMESFTAAEKKAARQLLMRLLSLEKDGTSFSASPQSEKNLIAGLDEATANTVLGRFRECGLIRSSPEGLTLSSTAVLGYWPEAREWLVQRRRLRGAARFWEIHKRKPGALLEKGEILDDASGYLDLDALETTFVEASRTHGIERERSRRRRLYAWMVGLAVVSAFALSAAIWALMAKKDVEAAHKTQGELTKEIRDLNAALQKEKDDLVVKNGELAAQRDDLAKQAKEAQDKLEGIEAFLQALLQEGNLTAYQTAKLNELAAKIGIALDSPTAVQASAPTTIKAAAQQTFLEPGIGLLVRVDGGAKQTTRWKGTTGFFVVGPQPDQRFVLGPRYLFDAPDRVEIFRIDSVSVDTPGSEDLLARLAPGALGKGGTTDVVKVPLPTFIQIRNIIPSVGPVTQVASLDELTVGQEVILTGIGSGNRRGKILRITADSGEIITERISTGGDAGAPVVTRDGRAVGILVASKGAEESQLVSLDFFLRKNSGLELLQPAEPAADSAFDGAIVQLLAPQENEALFPSLNGLLDRFRASGIRIPDEGVLPRKRTPKSQTEVRYYREADRALAEKIKVDFLSNLGVNARVSLVNDDTTPAKMIQISFSSSDLQTVHARSTSHP